MVSRSSAVCVRHLHHLPQRLGSEPLAHRPRARRAVAIWQQTTRCLRSGRCESRGQERQRLADTRRKADPVRRRRCRHYLFLHREIDGSAFNRYGAVVRLSDGAEVWSGEYEGVAFALDDSHMVFHPALEHPVGFVNLDTGGVTEATNQRISTTTHRATSSHRWEFLRWVVCWGLSAG